MNKEKEIEKLLADATKAAKSGLFKKPDWDLAAENYEKAAHLIMFLKDPNRAAQTYELASQAHYKAKNFFFAGKQLESAANVYRDAKDWDKAAKALAQAAQYYLEDNKPDKQAETTLKAGRLARDAGDNDRAIELCEQAIEIYEGAETWHLVGDAFRTTLTLYVKSSNWLKADQLIRRWMVAHRGLDQKHAIYRAYTELVIIHLAMDDFVGAEKALEEGQNEQGYHFSDECSAAEALIQAFQQRDPEALEAAAKKQCLTFLNGDIARLVKKLKIFGGAAPAGSPKAGEPAAPALDDLDEPDMR